MIAKLNAEHDAIVDSSHALRIAHRAQNREMANRSCQESAGLLHPHTRREQLGVFAEMKKDEMFTAYIESLCAEHDQLDSELEAISGGGLARDPRNADATE